MKVIIGVLQVEYKIMLIKTGFKKINNKLITEEHQEGQKYINNNNTVIIIN